MNRSASLLLVTLLLGATARAADTPAPAAPVQVPPAAAAPTPRVQPAAAVQAPPESKGEPAVEYTIVEDDGARVEQLKVRGEAQSVSVRTKGPLANRYEIVMPVHGSSGGAVGQRVWHLKSF